MAEPHAPTPHAPKDEDDHEETNKMGADAKGSNDHWDRYNMPKKIYGSRTVGGQKPTENAVYSSMESIDYTIPDTVEEAVLARLMRSGT